MLRRLSILLLVLLIAAQLAVVAQDRPERAKLQVYQTPYYILHTDLEPDHAREAAIRMTRMAEEYHRRTRDFAGRIRTRLPFYLYRFHRDYYEAGGIRGTAGLFDGTTLRAVAGEAPTEVTWHVIQHEGFHQFARHVIGGEIPIWANEGLADYFGEAQWTGDGFVSGVIPHWRLTRVRKRLEEGAFRPIEEMMDLSHAQWNAQITQANYDQAWMMVHFLAHGDNGKYQQAFGAFLSNISKGKRWPQAWKQTFGDTDGFETRWRAFWQNLPDHPTAELYAQATVSTLTSFLARASSQRQRFDTLDAFLQAGRAGEIKMHAEDWLPQSLLNRALEDLDSLRTDGHELELHDPSSRWPVVLTLNDGTRITGRFVLRGQRVGSVLTEIQSTRTASARPKPAPPSNASPEPSAPQPVP
jgi:hypothetical protein